MENRFKQFNKCCVVRSKVNTNFPNLLLEHSNFSELKKLAKMLPPRPQIKQPKLTTFKCRHCSYVGLVSTFIKKCPMCSVSLKLERDVFNVNRELKRGYGYLFKYKGKQHCLDGQGH